MAAHQKTYLVVAVRWFEIPRQTFMLSFPLLVVTFQFRSYLFAVNMIITHNMKQAVKVT